MLKKCPKLIISSSKYSFIYSAIFLVANKKPVILLLFNAGPLDISWAVSNSGVPVIMECFFPAQATGDALYQVFTNINGVNPAGRLPATWPAGMNQVRYVVSKGCKRKLAKFIVVR